ncbi:MAG TPA: ABC transporter ATP-binding protein [Candidatus Hydrogenedentes bacterium]|nr:ABC transporter ATP-binding protein [Candidatus Hydrogenedentota bacterium]
MNKPPNIIISCRKVGKVYHDGSRELVVLDGIDLDVPEGGLLTITGPSGVGKSTLLHIMGTLDKPSSGDVFFRDENLRTISSGKINLIRNREIGFVFQFYHLLPEFTALENIMMAALNKGARKKDCQERAEELLAQVGLSERATHKPGQLSGGEQQRVAIARALFNRPAVLLCDEPTGNLDERTGAGIVDLLCNLNTAAAVTLVIVTHDDSIALKADHWVALHGGKAEVRK